MKKAISIILASSLLCFSTEINAQSTLSREYLELIKKAKPSTKNIGKQTVKPTFTVNTVSPSKMVLPLDNMICVLPPTDTKYHILLAKPFVNDGTKNVNIPNAVPNIELVR